jgi:hypothetical protein
MMIKQVPTVFIFIAAWFLISVVLGLAIGLALRRIDRAGKPHREPAPVATPSEQRHDGDSGHGTLMRSR